MSDKNIGAETGGSKVPEQVRSAKLWKFIEDNNVGKLLHFNYDPKYKDRLWIYDKKPLIIMLESLPKGFAGINLHFAPNAAAAEAILRACAQNISNDREDITTRMIITYDLLKMMDVFHMSKECYRTYLFSHLRSGVMVIDPSLWTKAIYEITAEFKKGLRRK